MELDLRPGEQFIATLTNLEGETYHLILIDGFGPNLPSNGNLSWVKSKGGELPTVQEFFAILKVGAVIMGGWHRCLRPWTPHDPNLFTGVSTTTEIQAFGNSMSLYATAVRRIPVHKAMEEVPADIMKALEAEFSEQGFCEDLVKTTFALARLSVQEELKQVQSTGPVTGV